MNLPSQHSNIPETGQYDAPHFDADAPRKDIFRVVNKSTKFEAMKPEILETGIKSIDLFCPYPRGGKVAILGDHGTGKLVVSEELVDNIVQDSGDISLFTFVRPGTPVTWEHAQTIAAAMAQSIETIVLGAAIGCQ